MRSDEDLGDRSGLDPVEVRRNLSQRALVRDDELRVGTAAGDSKHALSGLPEPSFGAEFGYFAGELQPWNILRTAWRCRIVSRALEEICAIHSGSTHAHEHLVGRRLWGWKISNCENFRAARSADDNSFHCVDPLTMGSAVPMVSDGELEGVDAGIGRCQSGIRDVKVLCRNDDSAAVVGQELQSDARLRHEVYVVRARRDVVLREQNAAAKFRVRRDTAPGGKVPLEDYWIEAGGIARVTCVDQIQGNEICGIFEVAAQDAAEMFASQYFAEA